MNEGDSVTLNATGSFDSDGSIVGYAWDLDQDGQFDDANGAMVAFLTTQSGPYVVGLQVTDNRGATAQATAAVTVHNVVPTANAGGDQVGFLGNPISLSAAGSFDAGNDITNYAWDLNGDGQYDDAFGVNVYFSAIEIGTFPVGVQVTDADGASATDIAMVTVEAAPGEVLLLDDSFEIGGHSNDWNGIWVEDSQNDYFRSTQRSTEGAWAAEVDGYAGNATLTLANSINVQGYTSVLLTFDWLIESGFDSGEYLSLDISINGGTTWLPDVRRLSGNVDAENSWHNESVELTEFSSSNLLLRFRSLVSDSREDANIDNVRIVASSAASRANWLLFDAAAESTSMSTMSSREDFIGRSKRAMTIESLHGAMTLDADTRVEADFAFHRNRLPEAGHAWLNPDAFFEDLGLAIESGRPFQFQVIVW